MAVRAVEDGNQDIWLHEVNRLVKTRLTFDESQDAVPRWLPSGDAISFASDRSGDSELYLRWVDGNSPAEPLLNPDPSVRRMLTDWSDDARLALYYERPASEIGVHDLWYLERRDDGSGYEAVPFLQTPFSEAGAVFSPDEKWVASDPTNRGVTRFMFDRSPMAEGNSKSPSTVELVYAGARQARSSTWKIPL